MKSAAVIIPTRGRQCVKKAIYSVVSYPNVKIVAVTDSQKDTDVFNGLSPGIRPVQLPEPVCADHHAGHRIYAAFCHLVNEDYVFFLDEDNWYEPEHIASCVDLCEKNGLDWCYSLRNIVDEDGKFICRDDCESLGKWRGVAGRHLVDTSCYCLSRRMAADHGHNVHGAWGQDSRFCESLMEIDRRYMCTGKYTVNYRLGGAGGVTREFFERGNEIMMQKIGSRPWAS